MSNNKGFASVTLIIILAIIIIGGYLLLKEKPRQEPTPAPAPITQAPAQACLPTDPPSITVISPNGGETFQVGGQIPVTWQSCNLPTPWVVVSLRNGGDTLLTDPETSDDGNETFTLPLSVSSGNYQIRVGHAAAIVKQDLSDNSFSIQ